MSGKKRIVLIDDEPDILRTMKLFLESEDYEVITAEDGIDGFEKIKKQMPELVIVDIMLPRMDGYKLCRMLKFDDKFKRMPVIMFTAKAQQEDKEKGRDVGADAYLTKPFQPEELLGKIKELLGGG